MKVRSSPLRIASSSVFCSCAPVRSMIWKRIMRRCASDAFNRDLAAYGIGDVALGMRGVVQRGELRRRGLARAAEGDPRPQRDPLEGDPACGILRHRAEGVVLVAVDDEALPGREI